MYVEVDCQLDLVLNIAVSNDGIPLNQWILKS